METIALPDNSRQCIHDAMELLTQLRILLPGQLQPDRTSTHADPVFDRLAAGEVELSSPHLWMTRFEYSPILLPCQCTTANRERSSQLATCYGL